MAVSRSHRFKRWARSRSTALTVTAVTALALAGAGYLIVDAATTPVVGTVPTASSTIGTPGSGPAPAPSVPQAEPASPSAGGDADDLTLPPPEESGCTPVTFELSVESDVPVDTALYQLATGELDVLPKTTSPSLTLDRCPSDPPPTVAIGAKSSVSATTVTCTITRDGEVVRTMTRTGAQQEVYCYA